MGKFRKTHVQNKNENAATAATLELDAPKSAASMKRRAQIALATGAIAVLAVGVGVTTVYAAQSGADAESTQQSSVSENANAADGTPQEASAGSASDETAGEADANSPQAKPGVPVAAEGQYVVVKVREVAESEAWGGTPGIMVRETYQAAGTIENWISRGTSESIENYGEYVSTGEYFAEMAANQLPDTATAEELIAAYKGAAAESGIPDYDDTDLSLELKDALTNGAIKVSLFPTVVEALALLPGNSVVQGVTSSNGSVGDAVTFTYNDDTMVKTHMVFYDPVTKMPTGATFDWENLGNTGTFWQHIIELSVVDEAPTPNVDPVTGERVE